MWGWVARVGLQAAGFFFRSSGDIADTEVKDALVGVYSMIQALSNFLQALLSNEMVAWRKAGPHVVEGAHGLGNLAYNDLYAWQRMLHVIVPGSLRWLWQYVYKWANPKFTRIWRFLGVLDRRTKKLDRWQRHYADPWILNYIHFRKWYFTWPNATVRRVHDWFRHPKLFTDWATPYLMRSFLTWLTPPHHRSERDDWTRIIVGAAPDLPDQVGHAVYTILIGPPERR